jgi:hypothetical protein
MAKEPDQYSEEETKRRMGDGLRLALTTPHKPLKKFKGKSAATGKRKASPKKRLDGR